jgi:hypothetical protein
MDARRVASPMAISLGKRRNAADAVPRLNPKGCKAASVLRRCVPLVENGSTKQDAPCIASRSFAARGMKITVIGS